MAGLWVFKRNSGPRLPGKARCGLTAQSERAGSHGRNPVVSTHHFALPGPPYLPATTTGPIHPVQLSQFTSNLNTTIFERYSSIQMYVCVGMCVYVCVYVLTVLSNSSVLSFVLGGCWMLLVPIASVTERWRCCAHRQYQSVSMF